MPHLILEYSANLDGEFDVPALFEALHRSVVDGGVFPLAGIRSRAVGCAEFRVADGRPRAAFVHLTMQVGPGRDVDTRQTEAARVFDTLKSELDPIYQSRPLALSMEMRELSADTRANQNNLREHMAQEP